MNIEKLRQVIDWYKNSFTRIHNKEIYKWEAIKCFQDHWDIDSPDFGEMLSICLSKVDNLLDSGNYFPKRMVVNVAKEDPIQTKQLFQDLYDEEKDLIERITNFKDGFVKINTFYYPDRKDFQDARAIFVYLCLRYPERYFLYKFEMFKQFAPIVDYAFKPLRGKTETLVQFDTLCRIILTIIEQDNELKEMHLARLKDVHYKDYSLHILTQDIIYAAVQHNDELTYIKESIPTSSLLTQVNITPEYKKTNARLSASIVDHSLRAKENKYIGDLGELLVIKYEEEKLKKLGINKPVVHTASIEGDGIGYDILSYDQNGPIYIEVKTTTQNYNNAYYITRNELEASVIHKDKYYIYRLYDYCKLKGTANFYIRQGALTDLCFDPILYKVKAS